MIPQHVLHANAMHDARQTSTIPLSQLFARGEPWSIQFTQKASYRCLRTTYQLVSSQVDNLEIKVVDCLWSILKAMSSSLWLFMCLVPRSVEHETVAWDFLSTSNCLEMIVHHSENRHLDEGHGVLNIPRGVIDSSNYHSFWSSDYLPFLLD